MVSTVFVGGDKRDRTADLLNAIQALSQLSYTPNSPDYNNKSSGACQALFFKFRGEKRKTIAISVLRSLIAAAHHWPDTN